MQKTSLEEIVASDVSESLQIVNNVFENQAGAALDIVKLNAGAAIYASDKAASLEEGIEQASNVLENGAAKNKFQQYIELTKSMS